MSVVGARPLLLRDMYAMFASKPDARSGINALNAATREEFKG